MNQFDLNPKVDRNKVFLVKRSELEKRFDIDYYRPQVVALEKAVRRKSVKKLSDFIIKMASGATPSVSEEDKYYSDALNGVPFLRVQNLSTSGNLDLNNVRFINEDTHEGYLKRSQVTEGNLLVKITGVGRMAIGSVAPKGFVGNTNQHMVVIRTESEEQSWYLANYLNLDTVEALATRRATGGTRPALDYPALRSIPIIENLDFSIIKSAENLKQQKEQQAKALLATIDQYLLDELGIILPVQDNRLEKRIFRVSSCEVSGGRFDPKLYDHSTKGLKQNIEKSNFSKKTLRSLLTQSVAGDWGKDIDDQDLDGFQKCLVIRSTEFDNQFNLKLDGHRVKYRMIDNNKLSKIDIQVNDLLIEKSGGSPDQPVGRVALITKAHTDSGHLCYSNFIHKIRVDPSMVSPSYLFNYLKTMHSIKLTDAMQSQTNGIRNLIMGNFLNQLIVLPSLLTQQEIANKIESVRAQAQQLQLEAVQILADAKTTVERMILGEVD